MRTCFFAARIPPRCRALVANVKRSLLRSCLVSLTFSLVRARCPFGQPESPASEAGGWSDATESDSEAFGAAPRRASRRRSSVAPLVAAAIAAATPKKSAAKRLSVSAKPPPASPASAKAAAAAGLTTPATGKKRAAAEPFIPEGIPEGSEVSEPDTPGGRRVSARVAASATKTPSQAPSARGTRSSARGKQ